jgi:hypothetical protein
MVRLPINVLRTGCQTFSVTVFFLLAPISSIRQMRRLSGGVQRTYVLDVKCLVSLSDGLVVYSFPTLDVQRQLAGPTEPECRPTRPRHPGPDHEPCV